MLGREIGTRASTTGVRAGFDVMAGDPDHDIVRVTDSGDFDLVILGVHMGSGVPQRPFGETTAGRILRSSLTAALLVRGEAAEPYLNAVIGVDFSMYSRAAIRQAAQIAPAACMHLVHAYHVPFKSRLGTESFINTLAYTKLLAFDDFLKEEMDALEQKAKTLGIPPGSFERIILEGEPVPVLRSIRDRVNAGLVVVATHGRGAVSRAIWGSVAQDLFDDPPFDVLVIRPF